ncbi:MAG: hypothetical protein NVS2B4_14790 [Ramlibacter sp.]
MDPHYSGPPNLAFANACKTLGGKIWEKIGQVWYAAVTTSGAQPSMTVPNFAARTRQHAAQLFPKAAPVAAAVDAGWKSVGLEGAAPGSSMEGWHGHDRGRAHWRLCPARLPTAQPRPGRSRAIRPHRPHGARSTVFEATEPDVPAIVRDCVRDELD